MKLEKWLVVGTDERLKLLAKKLSAPNRTVFYKCTNVWDATMNATVLDYCPDYIVLPIVPLAIEVPVLLGTKHAKFYVGRMNEHWQAFLQQHEVVKYLEDESFIWKNASLTAEGLIAYFYSEQQSIAKKLFVVTGFGRVAKMIAKKLVGLDATVTIAVRSAVQKTEAEMHGYEAIFLRPEELKDCTAVINTIPTQWLTQPFNEVIKVPIYDVASSPGCLYYVTRSDYQMLPSLPGKYFADDAANVLYESIIEGMRIC